MRSERLREVAEGLGLGRVETVITTGNLLFDTDREDVAAVESMLEEGWRDQLGFESTTILRTQGELEHLAELNPFGDLSHGPETYLLVTFAKQSLDLDLAFPHRPQGKDYVITGCTGSEVFSVTDTLNGTSLDVMAWMETQFGKRISSRTWLTVTRILNRMRRA
jgi:uncharacterized protein (DUF1697 family)